MRKPGADSRSLGVAGERRKTDLGFKKLPVIEIERKKGATDKGLDFCSSLMLGQRSTSVCSHA